MGGLKGGLARKRALPKAERSRIARLAARKRWGKVMELLLAGNAEEAKRYVEKKYTQDIEELRTQLEEKERERTQLYAVIGLAKPNGKATAPEQTKMDIGVGRKIPKHERSDMVKQVAAEVAVAKGGKITPFDVVHALVAKGIDLGSAVPATVVGNVLYKAPDRFERLEKGIYRYIGAH
jgi:hypothetical protein